jgi:hypothetical protein
MNARSRKLVGALVMIGFVIAYALIAMTLAQMPVIQKANGLVQGLSYALLGLLWIVPLMPLIRWMERPER